jgi:hypothetical protein
MPKWLLIVLHVLVVVGGFAGTLISGSPTVGLVAGTINAVLPSPLPKEMK